MNKRKDELEPCVVVNQHQEVLEMAHRRGHKGSGDVAVNQSPRVTLLIALLTMRKTLGIGSLAVRIQHRRRSLEVVGSVRCELRKSIDALGARVETTRHDASSNVRMKTGYMRLRLAGVRVEGKGAMHVKGRAVLGQKLAVGG